MIINGRFKNQRMTGVQRFATEIVNNLDCEYDLVVPPKVFSNGILGHLWEQVYLPIYCFIINERLLCLCNLGPLLYFNKSVVIHDVFFKDYPNWYSRKFVFVYNLIVPLLIKTSKNIYTVSQYSKRRMENIYNTNGVIVLGNGVDIVNINDKQIANKNTFACDGYFLVLANNQLRKNLKFTLCCCVKFIKSNNLNYKVVVVGDSSKNFNSDKELNSKINDYIIYTGRVDDNTLSSLYAQCDAFLSLSLAEGFGIPVIESMAFGAPVICGNNTAYPESAGDAAILVDATSEEDVLHALKRVISEEGLREDLVQRGFNNIKRFNWNSYSRLIEDNEYS